MPSDAPAAYTIPQSRAWSRFQGAVKPVLKKALSGRVYSYVTDKYYWAKVFVNYLFIRTPWLRRVFHTGIWSQAVYIEGTNVCNARCVFCAYPQMERPKAVMSMEHFKSAIDQWVKLGGDEVDLTPIVGDPFVDRFIFERMDYLARLPRIRRFHFFTNAILMKPEHHERLCGYGAKLIIYNSFGGFDRETYHKVMGVDKFDQAVAAIRGLIEAKKRTRSGIGIQVNLRTPAGNERGEFWDYLQDASRQGLVVVDRIHSYDSWAGMVTPQALREVGLPVKPMPPKRGPCQRLLTSPVILADGRVNACASRDVEASLIIGDMNKQTLGEIFSGDALYDLVARQDRGDPPEVCKRCTYYDSLYPRWLQGRLFPLVSRLFR